MSWKQSLSVAMMICVLAALSLTGCRNRCGQSSCGSVPFQQPYYGQPVQQPYYGQPAQQPYFNQPIQQPGFTAPVFNGSTSFNGATSHSPLIPPPATGSLTIPSIARNTPFGMNQNSGLLNTNQAAPTPAINRSARFNAQHGWHGTEGAQSESPASLTTAPESSTTLSSNTATSGSTSGANSVLTATTSGMVAEVRPNANQGYGDSYLRSTDYSTTTTNETQDGTRLPATDASGVRAPSQYYARATGVQLARLPQQPIVGIPQPAIVGGAQPYYSGTFRTAAAPYPVSVAQRGVFAVNTNAVVLDQATATYDPYGDTRSADWRNRDTTSGTFQ